MTTADATEDRDETDDERADRRYNELLQELRVAQTGVQFLFAFLLTLVFTQRFTSLASYQVWMYVGTLLATAASSALLIGPVPLHRALFRRGLKPRLVTGTDALTRAGLTMLLVSINGAVLLILDVVLAGPLPFVLAGAVLVFFLLVWGGLPLMARGAKADPGKGRAEQEPRND